MFSELPKLLGRDFAVGHLLPVSAFSMASLWLLTQFGLSPSLLPLFQTDSLLGVTVVVLAAWLGSVLLLALNRELLRFMEGYGTFNPLKVLAPLEKSRFKRLNSKIDSMREAQRDLVAKGAAVPSDLTRERIRLERIAAERFPDEETWLLPTPFGNTIRAFEIYARVMYGLDAIPAWARLLAVVPKDYRELIDGAKGQLDFWVNLCYLAALFLIEYFVAARVAGFFAEPGVVGMAILVSWVAYVRACRAAVEWGDFVKAAFDLFLVDLKNKLEPALRGTDEAERGLWTRFTQAILYRRSDILLPSEVKEAGPLTGFAEDLREPG
jgi:hypothetical protein